MKEKTVSGLRTLWLLWILILVPGISLAQNTVLLYPGDIQQSVLNRRLRVGVFTGVHSVDSPCCTVRDWAIGGSLQLLLFRSSSTESYLVAEGVFSKNRNPVNVPFRNATVEIQAPDTRLWGMNLLVTGLSWVSHNPWHIFPYAIAGVGLLDRPPRNRTIEVPDDYGIPVPHTVTVADCGANAFCVNVGFGLQLYYVLRLDFRVSLPERSGMALYRTGLEFIF